MIHLIGCICHLIPIFLQLPINLISSQQFAQPHDFVPIDCVDLTAFFVSCLNFQLSTLSSIIKNPSDVSALIAFPTLFFQQFNFSYTSPTTTFL